MSRVSMRARPGGFDHVALVGEHFGDAPGELGVDVDLVRLDPAVARYDPQREASPGGYATNRRRRYPRR